VTDIWISLCFFVLSIMNFQTLEISKENFNLSFSSRNHSSVSQFNLTHFPVLYSSCTSTLQLLYTIVHAYFVGLFLVETYTWTAKPVPLFRYTLLHSVQHCLELQIVAQTNNILTQWGRSGSFKLSKRPLPGFLTILTL